MGIILTLGKQLLTMFLYMLIGFLLFKKDLVTKEGSRSLANLLLYCILPCVIIRSFYTGRTPEKTISFLWSLGLAVLALGLSIVMCALLFRKAPIDNIGCAFSNAGFMGIPLVTSLLGPEAVFYSAGFVAVLNVLQWTYGQWVLSKGKMKLSAGTILKNPIVISFLTGLALFASGLQLPEVAANAMNSISALNAPVAMIILGVYLAQTDLGSVVSAPRLYFVSLIRLILIPLITLACLLPFRGVDTQIILTIMLVASAPIGSNIAVYTQKLGMDYTYAVQTVCVSTVLSIISMPCVIALTQTAVN